MQEQIQIYASTQRFVLSWMKVKTCASVDESHVDSVSTLADSVKDLSDWFKVIYWEFVSLYEWFIKEPVPQSNSLLVNRIAQVAQYVCCLNNTKERHILALYQDMAIGYHVQTRHLTASLVWVVCVRWSRLILWPLTTHRWSPVWWC